MQPQEEEPQVHHYDAQAQAYSVPAAAQKMDLGGTSTNPSGAPFNAGKVFLLTGVFMLGTLVMIPIWNAVALLQDATFVFMSGSTLPSLIIAACISVSVMYAVTVAVFFRMSRPEVQTEQTILMIGSLFLALLGVLLLLLSTPLHRSADSGYQGIWNNCQFGPPRALFDASQVLHALRATPGCAGMQSIEECENYRPTPAALTLKAMESGFRCSGFCYQPLANSTEATANTEEGSLLQTHRQRIVRAQVRQAAQLAILSRQAPEFVPYPPTLFSQANFQATCDGMAARNMRNFAGDVADQTFYEGVMLVTVSIIIGFLKLLGFCGPQREERRYQKQVQRSPSQGYGAAPAVRQRHVSREELGLQ